MVDQAKRKTLKSVAGVGIGTVVASTGALAAIANNASQQAPMESLNNDLSEIEVATRMSSSTNELEIVITNTGSNVANITDMTPAEINTVRGRFDFTPLLKDGGFSLKFGESVVVPMQHHKVVLDGSTVKKRLADLNSALKQNVSVITDGNALAAVTVNHHLNFA